MFSLFRSRKSPRASPEPEQEPDNFVMLDNRSQFQPIPQQTGLYPLVDNSTRPATDTQTQAVPYLQDVPFKISPDLTEGDDTKNFQVQLDEMLAKLSRWNSVEEDYDFMLERSLIAQ